MQRIKTDYGIDLSNKPTPNNDADIDPSVVIAEFDQRVLKRRGIDVVLSNRIPTEENDKFDQTVSMLVEKHFKDVSLSKVLEIGVGIGRLARLFAPRTRSFVGIDFSSNMLESARVFLSSFDNVDLRLGDAVDLHFGENEFELGISCLVLKHNNDERAKLIIEKLKMCCSAILLIEHVTGGDGGSNIAVIRDKECTTIGLFFIFYINSQVAILHNLLPSRCVASIHSRPNNTHWVG